MGKRRIQVSEDLYARVRSENRGDETLGETLERMVDDYTLVDFAEDMAEIDPDFSVSEATDGSVDATPPSTERMITDYDLLDFARDAEGNPSLDVEGIDGTMAESSARNADERRDDPRTE